MREKCSTTAALDGLRFHQLFHRDPESYAHLMLNPLGYGPWEERGPMIPLTVSGAGPFLLPPALGAESWSVEQQSELASALYRDAFVSINSTRLRRREWYESDDLNRLNACWVDCDLDEAMDSTDALALLLIAERDGLLLPPSVLQRSGSGVWAYWLLTGAEDVPAYPPRARPTNQELVRRVNVSIAERLANAWPQLAPDMSSAKNLVVHQRVQGSLNSKTWARVAFTVNCDASGHEIRYTLEELAAFHGVEAPHWQRKRREGQPEPTPAAVARGKAGYRGRFMRPLEEVERILAARGALEEGTRRHACRIVATLMRPLGYSDLEIRERVLQVAALGEPPLPRSEALSEMRSALKRAHQAKPRHRTLVALLKVTPAEAAALDLHALNPCPPVRTRRDRAGERGKRHEAINGLVAEHGLELPLSLRALGRLLGCSANTVKADLRSLGVTVRGLYFPSQQTTAHPPECPAGA